MEPKTSVEVNMNTDVQSETPEIRGQDIWGAAEEHQSAATDYDDLITPQIAAPAESHPAPKSSAESAGRPFGGMYDDLLPPSGSIATRPSTSVLLDD
jgi:hypothetical protein